MLGLDTGLISSGLFGYNAILVGLALATFHGDSWSWSLVLATVFISVLSSLLFISLGRLLVPYKVPPFTLPFNLALFIYLVASFNMLRLETSPVRPPSLPQHTTQLVEMPSGWVFFEAVFKGVGQVWLADNLAAGIIITAGLALCSPITAFAAVVGSLVGSATALITGAPVTAIASGLYGYNSALTFGCIFGMWFCPSSVTFCVSIFAAVLATVMTDFVSGLFAPYGLPAATVPFCFCALLFDLIQGATPMMMPVPLAQMTVPEDHLERDQTIRRALRAMAAIVKDHKSGDLFRFYMRSAGKMSADKMMRDEDQAIRLFQALNENGDSILELDEFGNMLDAAVPSLLMHCHLSLICQGHSHSTQIATS